VSGGNCDDQDAGVEQRYRGIAENGSLSLGLIADNCVPGLQLSEGEDLDWGAFTLLPGNWRRRVLQVRPPG
jgi:hypothetical protein